MVFIFGYSIFSFTFTVIWSLRMEATFIFFGLDDAFGGTIKSESLKSQFAKSYHTR